MRQTEGRRGASPAPRIGAEPSEAGEAPYGVRPRGPVALALLVMVVAAGTALGVVRPQSGNQQQEPPVGDATLDGPPLQWERTALTVTGQASVSFAAGRYLLLEQTSGSHGEARSRVWQSPDGLNWHKLGSDRSLLGATVTAVTGGRPDEAVAVGTAPDEEGNPEPRVWRWTTGTDWTGRRLPLPPGVASPLTASPVGVVAGPRGLVATALIGSRVDPAEVIRPALPAEVAEGLGAGAAVHWGATGIEVVGPGGITIFQAPYGELAVDAELLPVAAGESSLVRWWSPDGVEWTVVETAFPGHAETVVATDDGFAAGGQPRWRSADGTSWAAADAGFPAGQLRAVARWGDRFIALTPGRLWLSDDAILWKPFFPEPSPDLFADHRGVSILQAGRFGILALGQQWNADAVKELPPRTIEKDGLVVDFGDPTAAIVVRRSAGDGEVLRVLSKGERTRRQVAFDFEAQTVTLADHETGREIVTLAFAEIWAGDDLASSTAGGRTHLVFTTDGRNWSRRATESVFGNGRVGGLAVGEKEVVAIVRQPSGEAGVWVGTNGG